MIAPLDPRTKQFYMQMGYTEQQVTKAYQTSIKKKIDILDALAQTQSSSQPPPAPPQKHPQGPPQASPASTQPGTSFLTQMAHIRSSDYETLYSRSSKFNPLSTRSQLRQPNNPVGLLNISNCCYLNSLLQCYFLMDKFKQILLTAEPLEDINEVLTDNRTKLKRVKGEYELLAKLKNFFTVMALSSKKYLDPTDVLQNLVDSVGEKLTYGQEKDLSEINIMIIERLSQGLTFSKKFYQKIEPSLHASSFIDDSQNKGRFNSIFNPQRGVIKQLFYGTKVEYYEQKQMEKQEPIVSDFTGIILNPRFGTLQNALDEQFNFSVEIKGQTFQKQMFIRQQPEYLFMYINRTQYDREQQQMHKNDEKFGFDFVLYLDRYMEKYKKERDQKDVRIRKLINLRNKVKQQICNLQLLSKKMEQCYDYARLLQGWVQKLPTQQEFIQQATRLNDQLTVIQRQLQQIQSRKQEYHLMYIFVHRGDAVSGHYWGYGRNGQNWYRFDVNCRLIPQDQIIIDMEKSSGTPYALLYVKKENIPQFKYNYHTKIHPKANEESAYCKFFDEKLAEEIVRDNILLHQEVQAKNNEIVKKKCFADYIARYNALKKTTKRFTRSKSQINQLDTLPLCNNFTLFLHSKQEIQLYKFSIFEQSLLAASGNKITIDRLMHEGDLLATIQKKFKLKCKGQLHLKNYAMVGKEYQKYIKLQEEYQLSTFEVVWALTIISSNEKLQNILDKINMGSQFLRIQLDGPLAATLFDVVSLLRIRSTFLRSEQFQKMKQNIEQLLYITQVNNQISKLIMLRLVITGFKFESLQKFTELNDAAGAQIATINSANAISISQLLDLPSSLTIVEEIQEIIRKFFSQNVIQGNRKNSTIQTSSSSKIQRRSSTKTSSNMDSVSSSTTSPFKSGAFIKNPPSNIKRNSDSKLTTFSKSSILFLDTRQTWKFEELDNTRPNFDLSTKIIAFLKRINVIVKIYKKSLEINRALSLQQLDQVGIVLNQPKVQPESLI